MSIGFNEGCMILATAKFHLLAIKPGGTIMSVCHWFCLLWLAQGLTACSSPEHRFAREAEDLGYQYEIVRGRGFSHAVFTKQENSVRPSELHVYLDGDGTPWIANRWVAKNPTPRDTLVLQLMDLDPEPALYLGRPCYHGLGEQSPCTPRLWTHERYSERVVASLVATLEHLLDRIAPCRLVLIGYSGGGTLAMLLAERLPQTRAVVTVAANLAVDAWARHHDYTPLTGSLDPAAQPPLNPNIYQLHLAGGKDQNVPANLIKQVVDQQLNAEFLIYEDHDHSCCWEDIWPSILRKIDKPSNAAHFRLNKCNNSSA